MFEPYHTAIVDAQFKELERRIRADEWGDVSVEREGALIYATVSIDTPQPYQYVSRIDMTEYPVEPYWVGFINPGLERGTWSTASDCDARYWPWSPMPGLHGSFIVTYQGPYRTFWCRECTRPFFHYHGDHRWVPVDWPLDRVVAHLRGAIRLAVAPNRWRPLQQQVVVAAAAKLGVSLPQDAALGGK